MARLARFVPRVALVGAVTIALAGCGSRPDETSTAGAAPGGTIVVPATEPMAVTATVAPAVTDVAAADTAEPASSAPAVSPSDTGAPTTTESGEPLGGVTVDDPLPAQSDAATDPAVAEAAVRFAYEHWLLVDLDPTLRGTLIENGEGNVDEIDAKLEELRGMIEFGRIHVETVAFTDADHASLTYRITWHDGPSPIFPNEMSGAAVFQNGTWRIASTTLCVLAFGVNTGCSASTAPNPTPPAALAVTAVPEGLSWLGLPESADVVNVGGATGMWGASSSDGMPSLDDGHLQLSVSALVGISALGPADLDAVLAHASFGGPESEPAEVGGRPGRSQIIGDSVTLVVVRADDTVVRVWSQGLTVDEVVAAAASMVPAEAVDEQVWSEPEIDDSVEAGG